MDGAEEAGGGEGGVGGEFADVGVGVALIAWEGGIADDAVGPEVDDFDFELVVTRGNRVRDIDAPRGAPDDTAGFAVYFDGGEFTDVA